MARSALTAPAHIVLQRVPGQFGAGSSVAPDAAISYVYGGGGLLDHRMPYNKYNSVASGGAMASVIGWASGFPGFLDQVIASAPAATTGGVVPAAVTASGTPMTLTTATTLTNGALVTAAALTTMPFGTVIPAGTVVVQSQMAYLFAGIRDVTAAYDPTNACARALAVTGVAGGAGGAFTVRGWDVYGQPMSEVITATAGATTVNGKKAWKWIKSITPGFTDGTHNYTFDVLNIFGLHVAVDTAAYVDSWIAGSGFQTNPTVAAADATAVSGTTGDVRGTVALTPAGNRITIFVSPSGARVFNPSMTTGLFGLVNFTN